MKGLLYFSLILFGFIASCTKASMNGRKMAGVYELYKYQLDYYNGDETLDSTLVLEDVAELGLYDNNGGTVGGNRFIYTSNLVPRSWIDNGLGIPDEWNTDGGRGKTITLSVEYENNLFIIYTINRIKLNRYTWVLVSYDPISDNINYVETLYVKHKK